jgi:hypothetical protein
MLDIKLHGWANLLLPYIWRHGAYIRRTVVTCPIADVHKGHVEQLVGAPLIQTRPLHMLLMR